ncbi:hypothetical protein [Hymenobacter rigui]|uniref:DoxX family protein n=1 Tax=Hymenobacter rigui TaxID=334424 RepID=A0A428KFL0_9BACT|nr:hypothetical protein [Hymenobacter rigui]RSK45209.1 hypothetical protein EI291_19040 [Hymenobacter rigui]
MAVTIPANDRRAATLIFLSIAVACVRPLAWWASGHISPYYPHWALAAIFMFVVALYVGIGLGIRTGKRWAKIVFLLYSLLNFALNIPHLLQFNAPPMELVLTTLSMSLHLWAFGIVARDLLRQPSATS